MLDLTLVDKLNDKYVEFLTQFAEGHKSKGLSFLIVSKNKICEFENITILPTLPEARDYLFMEIAERKLNGYEDDNKY